MPQTLRPQERFRWNADAARYIDQRTGRFVRGQVVRQSVNKALENAGERMIAVTNRLRAGRVVISEWQLEMAQNIKSVHLYSAAAAKGGWAQLTQSDYGHVGQIVRRQYGYLGRFAEGLENGEVALDGRLLARAGMYADMARSTFHEVERDDKLEAGYTEEANILNAGDSCAECEDETAAGFVPIGDLIPIGDRTCMSNCNCDIEYQ